MLKGPRFVVTLLGSLCIAAGINLFLVPFKVLEGGLFGLALILNYKFGADIGLAVFASSLPFFAVAWFHNRALFYNSLTGLIVSSSLITMLMPLQFYFLYYIELHPVTSAACGGFLVGTGLGLLLRFNISTGGTELLAKFLSGLTPLHPAAFIFITDLVVVGLGSLLMTMDSFILSLISISAGAIATGLLAPGHAAHGGRE